MTGPDLPDQPVPDKVLEELLAAFGTAGPNAEPNGEDVSYDFDDPSIDRILGLDPSSLTSDHPVEAATDAEPGREPAAREPGAPTAPTDVLDSAPRRGVVDLTGVEEVPIGERHPTPTGSTRHEARAAARTDAKAVKIATREAAKSAKATSKATAKASKEAAKEAKKAAKRGDARPPTAVPVPPGPATPPIDPLSPKPVAVPVARELVSAGAPGGPSGGRRTVVIADDDQPGDTLHLAADAEQRLRDVHASGAGSGGRSTIVIDDGDQRIDAVATQVASPNVDPRLRARRLAVHRAAGRRRLLWAGIIAGVVLLAVAIVAVLASSIFDARDIEVQGNQYTDPALVEQVLGELRGEPILLVDTQKLERELESSPWIESARVSTDFPHHVLIDIRERKPLATYAGSDGMFRVIDRDGRVLSVLGGRPVDYLLLTGTAPDSDPGQFAGTAYAAAAQLALALPDEIRTITTSIGVDATTNELTLALDAPNASGVHVRLGTVTGIEDKLARLVMAVRDGLTPDQQLDVATNEVGH